MTKPTERPSFVTDEHLEYLDDLREVGSVNMFAARPYLASMYPELTKQQSIEVLKYWMATFSQRHPKV